MTRGTPVFLSQSKMDIVRRLLALEDQKNAAYSERNKVVALAALLALSVGYDAGIGLDHTAEEGWQHVVYIELPSGQVSWHIPDSDISYAKALPYCPDFQWDQQTTDEKYERVLSPGLPGMATDVHATQLHRVPGPDSNKDILELAFEETRNERICGTLSS